LEKEAAGRFEYLRNTRIDKSKKDPFNEGYWQASFVLNIEPLDISLIELLNILKASKTGRTGWDIGWVPTRSEIAPYPFKSGIEVWLAEDGDKDSGHSDFWRAEPRGRFSLFRGFQEDGGDFIGKSERKLLDFSIVLWRVSEFLLYLENFSKKLNLGDVSATVKFHWHGLENRRLWNHNDMFSVIENETDICNQESIESLLNIGSCERIKNNLIDDVHKITLPLFESFNFFSIEKSKIKKLVKKLFDPDTELEK
jgi:transcriptional regulator with XRE-family HTH domain